MPGPIVVSGAQAQCSFGTSPGVLNATPGPVTVEGKPPLTITDIAPTTNVAPFGMCNTPSNPQVAAATAAALGVLTPQPCMPVVVKPWSPGAPRTTKTMPLVTVDSSCNCAWGGVILITNPGTTRTTAS